MTTISGLVFVLGLVVFDLWLIVKEMGRDAQEKKRARLAPDPKKEGNRGVGHP